MRPGRKTVVGFIVLALLQAIAGTKTMGMYQGALLEQPFAAMALLAFPGALLLLGDALLSRHRLPEPRQWGALVLLALPTWLGLPLTSPYVRLFSALHATPWGTPFLLGIAAPLWLALLAALHIVRVEVPRQAAGAAIAGIGAVCLLVPVEAYSVAPGQILVLLLEILLVLLTVYSWAYAREQLAGLDISVVAGSSLLLQAVASALLSGLLERPEWRPFLWRDVAMPWLLELPIFLAGTLLWFWLLQRLSLPAFCMNALALWTATVVLTSAFFGFLNWRFDLALAIAIGALTMALRARTSDEDPVALGLHNA